MKMNKKLFTIMLCVLIALAVVIPINMSVKASENESEELCLKRNVVLDDNGDYNVNLETYVKGEIKSVPSDVVILINETKRMDTEDKIGSPKYTKFSDNNISAFNKFNLYTLENNEYYKINIIRRKRNLHYYYYYTYTDVNGNEVTYASREDSGIAPQELNLYEKDIESKTRLEHSKSIAKKLVNDIKQDAEKNNICHRVAVTGFSDESNTGLYTGVSSKKCYNNLNSTDYKNGLIDVSDDYNEVENAINNIESVDTVNTRIDTATEVANNILNRTKTNKNKVVIIISDYNYDCLDESQEKQIMNKSIGIANSMKVDNNIKFLCIGINNDKSIKNNNQNLLLKFLSSNYSNVKNIDESADKIDEKFYISSDDSESINTIFKTVKTEKPVANIDLNNTTKIKDSITNEFNIDKNSIKTYTLDYNGDDSWINKKSDINTNVEITNNGCNITGFDFNKNSLVTKDGKYYGKKLVVEYKLKPNSNYFGGNKVKTNKQSSGIYCNNKLIKKLPQNYVDVNIKNIEFETNNINVYITEPVKIKSVVKNFSNIEINGTNNKDVKIEYIIKNNDVNAVYRIEPGNTKGEWSFDNGNEELYPLSSQNFNIQCKVYPTKSGFAKEKTNQKNVSINVFKPKIKIRNLKVDDNKNINLLSNINVEWVCDNKNIDELPLDNPPKLEFEFNSNSGEKIKTPNLIKANKNAMFKINAVKINNIDILNKTLFYPFNLITIEVNEKNNNENKFKDKVKDDLKNNSKEAILIRTIEKDKIKQIEEKIKNNNVVNNKILNNEDIEQEKVLYKTNNNENKKVRKKEAKSKIENISNADSASGKKPQSTTNNRLKKKKSVLIILLVSGITIVIFSSYKLVKIKPKKT